MRDGILMENPVDIIIRLWLLIENAYLGVKK